MSDSAVWSKSSSDSKTPQEGDEKFLLRFVSPSPCAAPAGVDSCISRRRRFNFTSPMQLDVTNANPIAFVVRWVTAASTSPMIVESLPYLHRFLISIGMTESALPSIEQVGWCLACFVFCLPVAVFIMRVRARRRPSPEIPQPEATQQHYLQERLAPLPHGNKEIRIFMDGAFDLMHYGHMNAFRLGRSLGTHLVVGINSDESIIECKGPPLMKDQERLTMVESCKFVDQVVPGCPYIMNKEYIDYVIDKYKIDYVIHSITSHG